MALSSTPSLTEINTELGTTGQSLVTCIANAGKTGVWTKQTDFANYSAGSISINPNNILNIPSFGQTVGTVVTSSSAWSYSTIPSWVSILNGSGVSGDSFTINVSYNGTGSTRFATIIIWLTSDHSIFSEFSISQLA